MDKTNGSGNGFGEKTLYLVDISSFIFRAFFAIRSLHNKKGEPTNAVYGVATMLARVAEQAKPRYLAVVYDSKEPSFRKERYSEYKANRSEPPEELVPQFNRIEELVRKFEIASYRKSGVEADDVIATLTKKWRELSPDHEVVIVSGDKDLMQLVDDHVRVWDTMPDKVYEAKDVEGKLGVLPPQVRDYLALVGDASDNIPGVPGIGAKTAAALLKEFGSLDGIFEAVTSGKITGKRAEGLAASEPEARLSRELATVYDEVDVKLDKDALKYRFHVSEQCQDLLKELDFHSLVQRWGQKDASVSGANGAAASGAGVSVGGGLESASFRTVNTESAFKELLEAIDRKKEFGFDVETTSLNAREAELVGIAVCHDPAFGCYIPLTHRGTSVAQLPYGYVLESLKPFLESPWFKKIGQNLKYDWGVLFNLGLNPCGIGADTMVGAYVLNREGRLNLKALAERYLDYAVLTYEEVCGKGKQQICFDQVNVEVATKYSAEDALVAVRLWDVLKMELEAEGLMRVFENVDLPIVQVLSAMECAGVCVDRDYLRKLSAEFSKEIIALGQRIGAYAKGPINLNSPKQLAYLLFEELKLPTQNKTKTGFSTDASVLEALAPLHEVPRLLLEYRELSKLTGTYVDPLPRIVDTKTGKIHTSFNQTVTATGRLSSSDPNLQNIPVRTERGRKIRRAFVPSPGNVFVSADYSQIELRLLAHMSADPELVRAFGADEDVHSRTASEIFSVPVASVDERMRGIAKAINFGLMYGKTAFGLSRELKIPRRQAQEVIDRYFAKYRGVKDFLDSLIVGAKKDGFVSTLSGRKRYLPDANSSNPAVRANAERMAMNTPIQGTAADLIKLAMQAVDKGLKEGDYKSRMILQVHDEIVLDCPKDEAAAVVELVKNGMEGAMELSVPLKVNVASGENWADL